MGVITSAIAAAAIGASAQSGPEAAAPVVVAPQPTYITAAAKLAPDDYGSGVTTHVNSYVRGEPVGPDRPDLAVVTIRGLTPWEPHVDVLINPWARQDGEIYDDFQEFGVHDGPFLGTNPMTRAIEKTQDRLERARQEWLRDNGHVGGVATFVNPPINRAGSAGNVEAPQPRATIRVPAGSSGGGNFRVEAGAAGSAWNADRPEGSAARDALARIDARRRAMVEAAKEQRATRQASAEVASPFRAMTMPAVEENAAAQAAGTHAPEHGGRTVEADDSRTAQADEQR